MRAALRSVLAEAEGRLVAWFRRLRKTLTLHVLRLLLAPSDLAALREELPCSGAPSPTLEFVPSPVIPTRSSSRFGSLGRLRKTETSRREFLTLSRDVSLGGCAIAPVVAAPPVRVVVFGSINIDLRADAKGRWPKYDATTVGTFSQSAGGKGANEAVALARLGLRPSLVGVVGDDEHARWLIERFQQDNVDTGGVRAMRQYADGRTASTGTAVQVVMGTLRTGDKRKLTVSCAEANAEVNSTDVAEAERRLLPEKQRAGSQRAGDLRAGDIRAGDLRAGDLRAGEPLGVHPSAKNVLAGSWGAGSWTAGRMPLSGWSGRVWAPADLAPSEGAASGSARSLKAGKEIPPGGGGAVPSVIPPGGADAVPAVLLLQMEIPVEPMLDLVRRVAPCGVAVAFKPSPLAREQRERVIDAQRVLDTGGVHIVFVNESEAPALLDWPDEPVLATLDLADRAAEAILDRWGSVSSVVVTASVAHVLRERGGRGWMAQLRGERGGEGAGGDARMGEEGGGTAGSVPIPAGGHPPSPLPPSSVTRRAGVMAAVGRAVRAANRLTSAAGFTGAPARSSRHAPRLPSDRVAQIASATTTARDAGADAAAAATAATAATPSLPASSLPAAASSPAAAAVYASLAAAIAPPAPRRMTAAASPPPRSTHSMISTRPALSAPPPLLVRGVGGSSLSGSSVSGSSEAIECTPRAQGRAGGGGTGMGGGCGGAFGSSAAMPPEAAMPQRPQAVPVPRPDSILVSRPDPIPVPMSDSILVLPRCWSRVAGDAIGAADGFIGGFVAAQCLGLNTDVCLLWAHAAATLCTREYGAQEALPGRGEVEGFIAREVGEGARWAGRGVADEAGGGRLFPLREGSASVGAQGETLPTGGASCGCGDACPPAAAGHPLPRPPLSFPPSPVLPITSDPRHPFVLHLDALRGDFSLWRLLPSTAAPPSSIGVPSSPLWRLLANPAARRAAAAGGVGGHNVPPHSTLPGLASPSPHSPPHPHDAHSRLRARLFARDGFGLLPLQRAVHCCALVRDERHRPRFGAAVRQAFIAHELLHPGSGVAILSVGKVGGRAGGAAGRAEGGGADRGAAGGAEAGETPGAAAAPSSGPAHPPGGMLCSPAPSGMLRDDGGAIWAAREVAFAQWDELRWMVENAEAGGNGARDGRGGAGGAEGGPGHGCGSCGAEQTDGLGTFAGVARAVTRHSGGGGGGDSGRDSGAGGEEAGAVVGAGAKVETGEVVGGEGVTGVGPELGCSAPDSPVEIVSEFSRTHGVGHPRSPTVTFLEPSKDDSHDASDPEPHKAASPAPATAAALSPPPDLSAEGRVGRMVLLLLGRLAVAVPTPSAPGSNAATPTTAGRRRATVPPPSVSSSRAESEALIRLLARAVCPVLEGTAGTPALRSALLEARDGAGRSLLLAAAHAGVDALVRSLCTADAALFGGADARAATLSQTDSHGRTALDLVVEHGATRGDTSQHSECASLLLKHSQLRLDVAGCADDAAGRRWVTELRSLHAAQRGHAGAVAGIIKGPHRTYRIRTEAASVSHGTSLVLAEDLESVKRVALKRLRDEDKWRVEVEILTLLAAAADTSGGEPFAPALLDHFKIAAPPPPFPTTGAPTPAPCGHNPAEACGGFGPYAIVMEEGSPGGLHGEGGRSHGTRLQRRADAERLVQCVNALHEVGSTGFVHCDIKPAHFLRFGASWRLVDFDSAVPAGSVTRVGCTDAFASPEVAAAVHDSLPLCVTPAIDVWALGLVLYELFTRRPLLTDETVAELHAQVEAAEAEAAAQLAAQEAAEAARQAAGEAARLAAGVGEAAAGGEGVAEVVATAAAVATLATAAANASAAAVGRGDTEGGESSVSVAFSSGLAGARSGASGAPASASLPAFPTCTQPCITVSASADAALWPTPPHAAPACARCRDPSALGLLGRPGGAEAVVAYLHTNPGEMLSPSEADLLGRMLVVDPESRAKLSELLRRTFFRPKATAEMKQITLLGLFCCPRFLPDGITPVPRLNLDREMREAVCALPWGERELYTAARFPQDLLSALGKGDSGTHGLSPRILHFSGHTHHRRSSDPFLDICFTPGLLVENEAGLPILLTAERIIPTLRESLAMCPRIQCLFLNCCNTTEIAEQVHAVWPDLLIISWSTVTADKAAAAFATGFYSHLGKQCDSGMPSRKSSLLEAFASGVCAFSAAGFAWGDPAPEHVFDETLQRVVVQPRNRHLHGEYRLHGPVQRLAAELPAEALGEALRHGVVGEA